ncbi:LPXTG cell wall anchor domain-containing protein [Staphylococcus taiwanensis]|nr:LPXTG cell wall anchor domain-containing protein [Staphylococcus taiwanensis]
MKKISIIGSTLLTSTVILTSLGSNHALAADIVTKDNAQQVASEALLNSGGNPDLQNLNKAIDKGNYFEIKSHNKANAGLGVYKVYKNGEVEYKNDKFSSYNQLQSGVTYAEHGIANAAEVDNQEHNNSKVHSVDCARELNSYYVGNVKSSEVPSSHKLKNNDYNPSSASIKTLPQTGEADNTPSAQVLGSIFLLLGGTLVTRRLNKKTS